MSEPEFHRPTSVADALALIGDVEALVVGGGTALALLIRERLVEPRSLVWLGRCTELQHITPRADGGVEIGAVTPLAAIAEHPEVRARFPMLAQAAEVIANPRIRAVATIGGALAHADPRQDLFPALLAAGASARLRGPTGQRTTALSEDFFRGFMDVDVHPDELITDVVLPGGVPSVQAYTRFTPHSREDYPTVSVAARLEVPRPGTVGTLHLALGGVSPTPLLVGDVCNAFAGGSMPTTDAIAQVAETARAMSAPVSDDRGSASYKRAMAEVWTRRVLSSLLQDLRARARL